MNSRQSFCVSHTTNLIVEDAISWTPHLNKCTTHFPRCFPDICSLPSETGRCRAAFPHWFHNKETGACEQFTYGGCGGNANNFKTQLECESRCTGEWRLSRHCFQTVQNRIWLNCKNYSHNLVYWFSLIWHMILNASRTHDVQVAIYRRLRVGRDGHLDQSELCDIS